MGSEMNGETVKGIWARGGCGSARASQRMKLSDEDVDLDFGHTSGMRIYLSLNFFFFFLVLWGGRVGSDEVFIAYVRIDESYSVRAPSRWISLDFLGILTAFLFTL